MVTLPIGRVHQKVERRLEDLLNLRRVWNRAPVFLDKPEYRLNPETGGCQIRIKAAKKVYALTGQPHLLFRFPQGGGFRRGILGVYLAAWKGYLPRMCVQMRRSLGQHDMKDPVSWTQSTQNRSGPLAVIAKGTVLDLWVQIKIRPGTQRRQGQSCLNIIEGYCHGRLNAR